MGRLVKVTFLGDAMCQMQQIAAVRKAKVSWDDVFADVRHLWSDSDYVVANLETPMTGRGFRLAFEEMRFNAPVEFLDSLRTAGVKLVSLANNHILDRGLDGLIATIKQVKCMGLAYAGVYACQRESEEIQVTDVSGLRIAWVACTYDTNSGRKSDMLPCDGLWHVDYVHCPSPFLGTLGFAVKRTIKGLLPFQIKQWLKVRRRGINKWSRPQDDSFPDSDFDLAQNKVFLDRFCDKIRTAKRCSDLVVALPHIGGQYNTTVGPWQRKVTNAIVEAGADLVVTNHAHTPLPIERHEKGVMVANALGNLCFTPRVGFYNDQCQADYSIALNCWIDVDIRKMVRGSFHVLKSVVRNDGVSVVRHVCDSNSESDVVCRRVTGREDQKCMPEVML